MGRGLRGNWEVDLEWSTAWRNRGRMKEYGWQEGRMHRFPPFLVLIEVGMCVCFCAFVEDP